MANNNGKIYKNKSVTPPLGVSIDDLQTVFGTADNDIGQIVTDTDVLINKWAKYKPLRSSKLGILTAAERNALNHGFVINKYTDIQGIEGASGDWEYLRPRAGQTPAEWFRFDDFAHETDDLKGYISDARSFVESVDVPTTYTKGLGGIRVQVNFTPDAQLPDGNVLLADLCDMDGEGLTLGDMYLGVLLNQSSAYLYKTSSDTIGDNGYWAEVLFDGATIDALNLGTCSIRIFAAYTKCETLQNTTGNINQQLRLGAYILPGVGSSSFTIEANTANMMIYRLRVSEITGGVRVDSVDVKYNSGVQTPVSNVNMKFYTNINGTETQIGDSAGYGGAISGSSTQRTGWVITPNSTATSYYDDFGLYYQSSLSFRTTYGTYLKAVLTYTIDQRTLTYTRSVRIGAPDPPVE